jgi:hypothetical protein
MVLWRSRTVRSFKTKSTACLAPTVLADATWRAVSRGRSATPMPRKTWSWAARSLRIAGNTVQEIGGTLYAQDIFTDSLFYFRSAVYNRIGVLDFS